MAATLLAAALTCAVALFLGQAALRLAGAREWSWLAPPVGISIAMLIAVPAVHVPGRALTMALVLGALSVAAIAWCARSPAQLPPLSGLLAALPVALLVLVPFLAAGRDGILGTSINNDLSVHLVFVEGYISEAVAAVRELPADYPLGPHAMVAALAEGLGIGADEAFSGWTMALPLLGAWTALAAARRTSWFGKLVLATVVGMPFLVAAYYGQGAFKEVLQAVLVLAVALLLAGCGPRLERGRWVPAALLLGGIVSVYSVTGLPWPFAFLGLWVAGLALQRLRRHGTAGLLDPVRAELPAILIGAAVLLAVLLPQLPRIVEFVTVRDGTGIPAEDIGNLIGPLPGWEALGVWNNQDFRLPSVPALNGTLWTAFAAVLVALGGLWALRRGRWLLPLAAAAAMAIWAVSDGSQSPYVSAKALVIASPLLLLLAVQPLVDTEERRRRWWPAVPLLGLVLLVGVGLSDLRALRYSPVGPTDHLEELRSLRPVLDGRPTLFLGQDDYVEWGLAGVPVGAPAMGGVERIRMRPRKDWEYGRALDFDSVDAATLNEYEWVIATRDAAGSTPPPQLRLVRETPSYALWRRTGRVRPRSLLAEGEMPGALLECDTRRGREIVAGGGVAAIRPAPVVVPVSSIPAGGSATVGLPLVRGTWDLETTYTSPQPVEVSARGLRVALPANLDRPGPRWPLGRVEVPGTEVLSVELRVDETPLTPAGTGAPPSTLIATPMAPVEIVPVQQACGRYVDWYRSAEG